MLDDPGPHHRVNTKWVATTLIDKPKSALLPWVRLSERWVHQPAPSDAVTWVEPRPEPLRRGAVVVSGLSGPLDVGAGMSTGRTTPSDRTQLEPTDPLPEAHAPLLEEPKVDRPSFGLAIGRALGTVVVTLHGELSATTSPQVTEVLRDLIDDQGNLSVVIDARDLTVSGPDGVAAFVVAAQWARRHGGRFALAHASDGLRQLLRDNSADHFLHFAD
jgi:anti-anti-sigma factor